MWLYKAISCRRMFSGMRTKYLFKTIIAFDKVYTTFIPDSIESRIFRVLPKCIVALEMKRRTLFPENQALSSIFGNPINSTTRTSLVIVR